MTYASLKKATAIGNPSEGAAGLFRVVLRIDGESLVILASQACLLERLDIGEKVSLSLRADEVRPDSGTVQ